jgi:uncharacterized protein YcfJ
MIIKRFSAIYDYDDFEDRYFSEDRKLRVGDKFGIWGAKHLRWKKLNEAIEEATDEDKEVARGGRKKLAKESAKINGVGGAIAGALAGKKLIGGTKGAAIGAVIGAAGGAGSSYIDSRIDSKIRRGMTNLSGHSAKDQELIHDRARVASGHMTKEQYAKKHGRLV